MRLRTVLMTALLAMLGLLPMALSHGIGSETQRRWPSSSLADWFRRNGADAGGIANALSHCRASK